MHAQNSRPAAFLDRDGVINVDHGYTSRPEDLAFTPTAAAAIRKLNQADYLVLVITNQSGVARGYYGASDVERFHAAMQDRLAQQGARIDGFYYCPFHPEGVIPEFACDHEDRKPRPGMILRAMRDWAVRQEGSFLIGDKDSDMAAAAQAGVPGWLVPANVCDLAMEVGRILEQSHASRIPVCRASADLASSN